ncbi:MAG: GGDEF domain-containing protein [Deltaproteobacteria bacterium]|nr:GGDEF domain-containing protein [Deltaproteobacteria bacterium]
MNIDELNALRQFMDDHGWRLRFNNELEREFQQDYTHLYCAHMQIAGIIGLIVFMTCGVLDIVFMPEVAGRTWFIRLVAGAPMLGLMLIFFRRGIEDQHQLFSTIFYCVFVGGMMAIALNSPEPYSYYYYNSVTIVLIILYAVSRIQFKWGVCAAIIMLITINVELICFDLKSNISFLAVVLIGNYVFIASSGCALIGAFLMERSLRQNYLQSRMISITNRQLEELNLSLQFLSTIDGLTQIANRRSFDSTLSREWQRAKRNCESIGFIMLDIDHFKLFNDTYGHQAGDECLSVVGSLLKGYARRPGDLAARYGGEEFALMLIDTSAEQARIVAEQLCKEVSEKMISNKNNVQVHVTASLGVASIVPGQLLQAGPEALILAADQALYHAKRSGRNRVVVDGGQDDEQK